MSIHRLCDRMSDMYSDLSCNCRLQGLNLSSLSPLFILRHASVVVAAVTIFTVGMSTGSLVAQDSPGKAEEVKPDPDKLPPGYVAPPGRLAIQDRDEPLVTRDELAKMKRDAANFTKVRQACDVSPSGRKVVEAFVRFRFAEMTVKELKDKVDPKDAKNKSKDKDKDKEATKEKVEVPPDVPALHKRFIADVTNIGDRTKKPADIQEMAKVIGQEIVKQVPVLLKNNFYVRLHATQILGEIDYAPAYEVLVQILQSKDITEDEANGQPEAVKIAAINSLTRIVRFATPTVKERTAIAQAIVAELKKPNEFWWKQNRLIDTLRYCDVSGVDIGDNDRPYIIQCLLAVVKDASRPWKVRTHACYALGRVAYPKSANLDEIVTTITECALQLANEAAAEPKNIDWKRCFANIYLAFHAGGTAKDKDLDSEGKQPGGLLNRAKGPAQQAYQVLLPIFNDVGLGGNSNTIAKPPTAENLRKLNEFVQSRRLGGNANASR